MRGGGRRGVLGCGRGCVRECEGMWEGVFVLRGRQYDAKKRES